MLNAAYFFLADIKRIAKHILHGPAKHETFNRLARLGDKFGHRMVGSDALEKAIGEHNVLRHCCYFYFCKEEVMLSSRFVSLFV